MGKNLVNTFYDLGGAEDPIDANHTIVDNMPKAEWEELMRRRGEDTSVYTYIEQDLGMPGWSHGLPKAEVIHVNKVLRYLCWPGGYLIDLEAPKPEEMSPAQMNERFGSLATEINLLSGDMCKLVLFDHIEMIAMLLEHLIHKGWRLCELHLVNYRDTDFPSEWKAILHPMERV